ncbi:ferrochelatase [Candidatus Pantoea edessiphila]|uniref:Ferrochelatase n=1 Tax=Candidatus Pantoea edessiphila TaxID=2044610 RepID=A0A2P5SXD5_9GAMM|nr:ferrochelatase [Candidatus Pantoea edessiphila]MBK4775811.1 ferrochelatase [Pantoea sp. Edef]PPI87007.1 ferrochelatase [Candidatus Pantoea edessiphila]
MKTSKAGVLLVNLGSPDAPTRKAIKRYLRQFLSDKRIIDIPAWIWWPILNSIVLPFRSIYLSKMYSSIWRKEGSPLMIYSKNQRDALAAMLNLPVEIGMNYGNPSIKSSIDKLMLQGINRLIVLPLYPQFSSATVASVWDSLYKVFKNYKSLPNICFIRDYADHPAYINALKICINRSFKKHGKPDLLLISYHGIPKRLVNEGDDYFQRCLDTTNALVKELKLKENQFTLAFQSRFGYEPWLTPYIDKIIQTLPAKGIKYIHVISPGFSCDCLETLEELDSRNRNDFIKAGGQRFEYIPALNAENTHIDMMCQLIDKFL